MPNIFTQGTLTEAGAVPKIQAAAIEILLREQLTEIVKGHSRELQRFIIQRL